MISKDIFIKWAKEFGFSEIGFCLPEWFEQSQRIVESQQPLQERKQLRFAPKDDYPQIRSIAVMLWPYLPAKACSGNEVFVDSYYEASNAAYHAARELEAKVLTEGAFVKANVPYPAKEAAVRAGLGVIGKNSLLITPQYGTRVVIILMATDIDVPPENDQLEYDACVGCGCCAQACPAGAITEQGLAHPQRCLRNFMMEGVVIPEDLREEIGMRLIGCDICQSVCPMQPNLSAKNALPYRLDDFMSEDPGVFSSAVAALANEIGRNTARPQRVRAQAALLAGNSKKADYLPVLAQWAQSPFEAVREHAKWAISRIESNSENT